MRAARLTFALLALSWVVLLCAAPLTTFGAPASALVYAFGSLICHQRPERSFHIDAAQLPVCARCFGIYAGAALAVIAGRKPRAISSVWRSPSGLRTLSWLRTFVIAAAIPTGVTWASESAGFWAPGNLTRFLAALPLGAAIAVTVNYVECARPRRTGHSRSPTLI